MATYLRINVKRQIVSLSLGALLIMLAWCGINTFCHLMAGDISNVIFFGVGQANTNKSQFYSLSSILEMPACHINILSGILYTCISFRGFLFLISLNFVH